MSSAEIFLLETSLGSPSILGSSIGRTDAECEAPIFWPTNEKSRLTEKAPDAGKD